MGYLPPLICSLTIALMTVTIVVLFFRLRYFYKISHTDEMTGIDNYRGFRKAIHSIISRNKKNNTPFTVAILDIDQFRKYNSQSYAFGDLVLSEFVQYVKQQLPADAYMARFRSGDEFIVVLNSEASVAGEVLKKIQKNCRKKIFTDTNKQREFSIRFSFGYTGFSDRSDTLETMIERIEQSLRANKPEAVEHF
jgi:diguanylate cyclase